MQHHPTKQKIRATVGLLAGLCLLVGIVAYLDIAPRLAFLGDEASQPAAAAWSSNYPSYQGWPVPHFTVGGSHGGVVRMCDGVNQGAFLCGWCQAPGNCPLPSYAAVYPAADPSQAMVAKVILPGKLAYPNQAQFRPYQGPTYTGSNVSVPQGQGVTLEWACQNWQAYSYSYGGTCTSYDAFDNCNGWSSGGTGQQYFFDYGPAVGVGFTAGTHVGQTTVYPTQTTTYGVYCPASGWIYNQFWTPLPRTPTMSFTVNVGPALPPPPPPTETIDAGAGPGVTKTVVVGTSVTITAIYTPGSGDTFVYTAVDGPLETNGTNCASSAPGVSGLDCSTGAGTKSFTFTPPTAGTYTFVPDAWTTAHPNWNNNSTNASVQVVATAPPTCTGPNQVNPPTCNCDVGYTGPNGGPCVVATCSDPNATNPPTCACGSGYSGPNGGPCTLLSPTLTLSATQSRVRKGSPASISWSVSGLVSGSGAVCTVSSSPAGVFSAVMPANTAPTWSGNQQATGLIQGTTVFTLSCTGAASKSITVGLIPNVKEI